MEDDEEPWGQLIWFEGGDSSSVEPIPLVATKITIGRAKDCDIPTDSRLVSGRHCFLEREDDGKVYLHDTSKNGTLVNKRFKVTNGNKKELSHTDEFYVVYKEDVEQGNVGFRYESMEELQREMEHRPEPELEATLVDDEINIGYDDEDNDKDGGKKESSTGSNKRKLEDTTDGPEEKKTKQSPESSKSKAASEDTDEIEEALICTICQELLHDCISLQPCMHSFCAGCYSDWMDRSNECPTCRMKVERINKNHIVNNLIDAYLKEHPGKKRPEEDLKELDAKNKISRDMLYPKGRNTSWMSDSGSSSGSVSDDDGNNNVYTPFVPLLQPAQPVLHGFGTPVFGTWNRPGRTVCRQCQGYVEPVTVTAITQNNPTSSGCQESNNAATTESVRSDVSSDDSQKTVPLGEADDAEAGPSNANKKAYMDVKVMPTPPQFQCTQLQNHVLCQCCLQPMPDRRKEYTNDPTSVPPQQCTVCYRSFCHAYWGCRKVDCNGCIARFRDLTFGKKCLTNLILDNPHESEILKNYLEAKDYSVKQMLTFCIEKLEAGEFTCIDHARHRISGNTPLCYPCGLRNFKELAYLYRFQIPKEDLPADVTSRSDCYWGKNCRTQRNKPLHAQASRPINS